MARFITAGSTARLEGTIITGMVNLHGDPAFVDPATWDYHLGPTSAAIDAGVDAGMIADFSE